MRIGLFTDSFAPSSNGIITSMRGLRAQLESLGHQVYIFAPKIKGYKDIDDNVIRLPAVDPVFFEGEQLAVPFPGVLKTVKKYELDIIHSHTEVVLGLTAHVASTKLSIPHVTTVHTLWAELAEHQPFRVGAALGLFSLSYQLVFKQRLKVEQLISVNPVEMAPKAMLKKQIWIMQAMFVNNCDAAIVPSNHLFKSLTVNKVTAPMHVIPNGIDTSQFSKTKPREFKGSLKLLSVGRLSPEKRQDVLISALSKTQAKSVSLTIVGTGSAKAECQTLVKKLGVASRVEFMGQQDRQQIVKLMHNHDVFVLASSGFDNQPMVILEAISAGLPVMYCDPRLKEGLNSTNSMLTKTDSAESLAKVIDQLAAYPSTKLRQMSHASIQESKKHDISVHTKRVLAVYTALLGKAPIKS